MVNFNVVPWDSGEESGRAIFPLVTLGSRLCDYFVFISHLFFVTFSHISSLLSLLHLKMIHRSVKIMIRKKDCTRFNYQFFIYRCFNLLSFINWAVLFEGGTSLVIRIFEIFKDSKLVRINLINYAFKIINLLNFVMRCR